MQRWLVGGAVRDRLLQLEPKDSDWLVLGTTDAELRARGFRPVGKSFTVYLPPGSHEEHALPRGVPGGTSGDLAADLAVDLERRDFTVNAMAIDPQGDVHDPFGGRDDLARRETDGKRGRATLPSP